MASIPWPVALLTAMTSTPGAIACTSATTDVTPGPSPPPVTRSVLTSDNGRRPCIPRPSPASAGRRSLGSRSSPWTTNTRSTLEARTCRSSPRAVSTQWWTAEQDGVEHPTPVWLSETAIQSPVAGGPGAEAGVGRGAAGVTANDARRGGGKNTSPIDSDDTPAHDRPQQRPQSRRLGMCSIRERWVPASAFDAQVGAVLAECTKNTPGARAPFSPVGAFYKARTPDVGSTRNEVTDTRSVGAATALASTGPPLRGRRPVEATISGGGSMGTSSRVRSLSTPRTRCVASWGATQEVCQWPPIAATRIRPSTSLWNSTESPSPHSASVRSCPSRSNPVCGGQRRRADGAQAPRFGQVRQRPHSSEASRVIGAFWEWIIQAMSGDGAATNRLDRDGGRITGACGSLPIQGSVAVPV